MRFRLRANLSERRREKQASAIARELIPAPTPELTRGRWRTVFNDARMALSPHQRSSSFDLSMLNSYCALENPRIG
jgi:hypothetical protein